MRSIFGVLLICAPIWAQLQGPISQDFQQWLSGNGYSSYNFARTDLGNYGSYGGKTSDNQSLNNKNPVIFIHGNSDQALRNPGCSGLYCQYQTGWDNSIQYFQGQGYTTGNLYASTWGDANGANAQMRTHNCQNVMQVRKFIDAVLAYTGASKIEIVAHSMGVTLGRKAIQGGSLTDELGVTCNVGMPLTAVVDTFVGISGANFGLCSCQYMSSFGTCNSKTGFFPGASCGFNFACGFVFGGCSQTQYSTYMTNLNSGGGGYEGAYRYAIWSTMDDIIQYQDNVWGQPTSRYPGMTASKVYTTLNHMQTKDNTASVQYNAIVNHQLS